MILPFCIFKSSIGTDMTIVFNNALYTTNFPTEPHTVTTTDKQTIMRHIHTSIVSRHLAPRGNNKILRTPPPHISSSEEILPRPIPCTLSKLRTNKSAFLKIILTQSRSQITSITTMSLCNTHTYIFNCTHIRTTLSPLYLWTDSTGVVALLARWMEKLAGEPQSGRSHLQGSWEWVDNNRWKSHPIGKRTKAMILYIKLP